MSGGLRFLSALMVLCLAVPVLSQPLADRVPADAVAYVGWRGTDDLGPGYEGSHLQAIAKESSFQKLLDETFPAAIRRYEREDPKVAETLALVQPVVKSIIRLPSAAFFGGVNGQGEPRFGVVCQAGAESAKVLASFEKLAREAPRRSSAKAFATGDVVAVVFGYAPDEMALAGAGVARPEALAEDAQFKAALARAGEQPVVVAYLNVRRAAQEIEQSPPENPDGAKEKIGVALKELGLAGINSAVYTGSFKNRNWEETIFVDAPSPRGGLLGLIEGRPFSDELLARVPASATYVNAGRYDLAKGLSEIRRAAQAVDPQWGDVVGKGLAGAKMAVYGKDLQDDILGPLGDEWVLYASPEIAGVDLLGIVAVNKLDDPAKAKSGLVSLATFLSASGQSLTARRSFKLTGNTVKIDDTTIYYYSIPVIAPAFTIKDGYLYAGFYPQSVAAAVKYNGKSIQDNDAYKSAMAQFEKSDVVAMRYDDVKAYMPTGYAMTTMLLRTGLGFADLFAAQTPEMVLPPLPTLLAHAEPSSSITWTDEAGIYSRTISPFPGARTMSQLSMTDFLTVGNPAVLAGGLLVPMRTAVEDVTIEAQVAAQGVPGRIDSANKLRQIGQAMKMHEIETGNFPADLKALLDKRFLTEDALNSPMGDAPGGDFVYLQFPGVADSTRADVVLAYDAAALGEVGGTNVLFADGHVEWFSADDFWRTIERSREIEPRSAPKAILGR